MLFFTSIDKLAGKGKTIGAKRGRSSLIDLKATAIPAVDPGTVRHAEPYIGIGPSSMHVFQSVSETKVPEIL